MTDLSTLAGVAQWARKMASKMSVHGPVLDLSAAALRESCDQWLAVAATCEAAQRETERLTADRESLLRALVPHSPPPDRWCDPTPDDGREEPFND